MKNRVLGLALILDRAHSELPYPLTQRLSAIRRFARTSEDRYQRAGHDSNREQQQPIFPALAHLVTMMPVTNRQVIGGLRSPALSASFASLRFSSRQQCPFGTKHL